MRDRIVRNHRRKSVLVTLKSGEAFRGVLFDADRDAMVLRSAHTIIGDGTDRLPVGIDGELVILRPDVAYMQFT